MTRLPLLFALALLPAALGAETAEIVPNENLVLDGLPKVPASVADSVGRYTEFRAASFLSWHPVRREMLIATRFADTSQVHAVAAPGADRSQMTFFPDAVSNASFPGKEAGYLVFTKDKGGDEFRQIHRLDLASGDIALVSDGKRSQNSLGPFSWAGDRMAFGSTARNGADRDIYVVDPKDPGSLRRVLEVQGGGWGPLDWSRDDRKLLVGEYLSVNESYLWLVDVASGEKKLLTPKGSEKVAYGGGELGADGKSLYVTTDKQSEFQRLARIDLATGAHTYLTSHIPWDVETWDLSPDGKMIAFVANENGVSTLHLLDTAGGKELKAPKLPVGVMGGVSWHNNSRDLAFELSGATSPYDVYSLHAVTGKVDRWTTSETGGLNAAGFTPAELVSWPSFDGKTISGFLYKPSARWTGKRPVIVNIHGGPEGQERPDFLGRSNFYTSELGIAMLYPNVRGSTGFGKTFVTLDNGMKREDSVKDIGALLDWLKTRPDLDAERVMITGGSYGGYMTLASAMHFSDRVRCFLDVVGISSFVSFLENTEAYRRDLRRVEYGDEREPEMRAFFQKISPLWNVARMTKPMFIVQGQNDPRVPVTESEQIVAALKKQGTTVWYLKAKDEGHGFRKKKNADFQFYATVAFVQEYLLK